MALLWSSKKRSKNKAEKYWRRHHKRWERSGISQAEYCRKEGISLPSFTAWRGKLASEFQECSDFVEIAPVHTALPGSYMELTIPSVGILRIPEALAPEILRVLLLTVKGSA